jgi:hypothetical protein
MRNWTRFERAELLPHNEDNLREQVKIFGISFEEFKKIDELARERTLSVWKNNLYQVLIKRVPMIKGNPPMLHLSIKRLDKEPIHDWRDLQRIKNELIGPEHEAFEIYPAESRVVDTANQYHLWVFKDPEMRIPVGWQKGLKNAISGGGAKQRPFEE